MLGISQPARASEPGSGHEPHNTMWGPQNKAVAQETHNTMWGPQNKTAQRSEGSEQLHLAEQATHQDEGQEPVLPPLDLGAHNEPQQQHTHVADHVVVEGCLQCLLPNAAMHNTIHLRIGVKQSVTRVCACFVHTKPEAARWTSQY